ncbi:hypothetical protein FXF51_26275 [Nonomuraea sp. PA05]|uniref:hypothetical protein n=1 Tax=Nonomuraea sp. PA05 TaxID=2604466 RepID=UPI0011DBB551|nr:hypothetical protein [Nonomuraea sp. PA05]TYB62223.1 hypothetical protein FXF51_26275 [Nonomuraea sp. PA05]
MLPFPTTVMLTDIEKDKNYVWAAYARLITGALAKVKAEGAKLGGDIAVRYDNERLIATMEFEQLNKPLPAMDPQRGQALVARAKGLPKVVVALNKLMGWVPPLAGDEYLRGLIDQIESKVVVAVEKQEPLAQQSLQICFGDKAAAAVPRFRQILTQLQALYARTDDKGKGLVHGPALPATMGALAHGTGDHAHVDLGTNLINGLLDRFEAAASLFHEASHTLPADSTVDFAYRNKDAHYLLPPGLAFLNAASYEQVVLDLLNGKLASDEKKVAALRHGAGTVQQAHALLASRVTRAWVRAYDLHGVALKGGLTPDMLAGLPPMPQGDTYKDLLTQLVLAFQEQMNTLMQTVSSRVTIVGTTETDKLDIKSTPQESVLYVPYSWAGDRPTNEVSVELLRFLADKIWPQDGDSVFSGSQLSGYVASIHLTDRPELQTMLQEFYSGVQRKPKID